MRAPINAKTHHRLLCLAKDAHDLLRERQRKGGGGITELSQDDLLALRTGIPALLRAAGLADTLKQSDATSNHYERLRQQMLRRGCVEDEDGRWMLPVTPQ